jgi:hypothetical protein
MLHSHIHVGLERANFLFFYVHDVYESFCHPILYVVCVCTCIVLDVQRNVFVKTTTNEKNTHHIKLFLSK